MFSQCNHIGHVGLGFTPAASRMVSSVPAWALAMVPRSSGENKHIKENETVEGDTIPLIKKIVSETLHQTKKLATKLKGSSLEETLRNDTNFILKYIRYRKDATGKEQVREPARLVWDAVGDCDCFAVFLSSSLSNQKIEHAFRIMKQNGSKNWSHIYVVVPKPSGGYYTLDPVTNQFNTEPSFTEKKDFTMALERLSGIGISGFECVPANNSNVAGLGLTAEAAKCKPGWVARNTVTYVDTTSVQMDNLVPTKKFLEVKKIPFTEVKTDNGATALVVQTDKGAVAVPTVVTKSQAQQIETAVQETVSPPQEQAKVTAPSQAGFGWLMAILIGGGLLMAKKSAATAATKAAVGKLNGPVKLKSKSKTKKYKTLHL